VRAELYLLRRVEPYCCVVVPILSLIWSAALPCTHGELHEEAGVARADATCRALMHHVELLFPFAKVGLFLVVCDMYPCNRYFLNSASPFSFGSSGFRNQLEASRWFLLVIL
jgi:hypothetical protein